MHTDTTTHPPAWTDVDAEQTTKIAYAEAACPWPTSSPGWHSFGAYLDNAAEPDSAEWVAIESARSLAAAATDYAESEGHEVPAS